MCGRVPYGLRATLYILLELHTLDKLLVEDVANSAS